MHQATNVKAPASRVSDPVSPAGGNEAPQLFSNRLQSQAEFYVRTHPLTAAFVALVLLAFGLWFW